MLYVTNSNLNKKFEKGKRKEMGVHKDFWKGLGVEYFIFLIYGHIVLDIIY